MPLKDPIARAEYDRKRREAHREEAKERTRKWRQENPDKLKAMLQANYLKHRDERIAKNRAYSQSAKGKETHRRNYDKFRLENPEKFRARQLFKQAVRCGKIVRQPCSYPGCKVPNAQGHHKDYSKPYEVEWYCFYHHKLIEGKILVPRPENTGGNP